MTVNGGPTLYGDKHVMSNLDLFRSDHVQDSIDFCVGTLVKSTYLTLDPLRKSIEPETSVSPSSFSYLPKPKNHMDLKSKASENISAKESLSIQSHPQDSKSKDILILFSWESPKNKVLLEDY